MPRQSSPVLRCCANIHRLDLLCTLHYCKLREFRIAIELLLSMNMVLRLY